MSSLVYSTGCYMKLLDDCLCESIWDYIYSEFKFNPSVKLDVIPFKFNIKYVCYTLESFWDEEEENIVNDIFKSLSSDDIYALDWHHDCYSFNPWCDVLGFSYYPDGDYYFYVSKDFKYGMFGHPWRKEIYVFGDELVNLFKLYENRLGLKW